MATKKSASPPKIYQLKVTLLGTKPPIWRRLLVSGDMTLKQLHEVLQEAMGWEDYHMHDFRIGEKRFGVPDPEDDEMGMPATADERKVRLSSMLSKVGAKAVYTYDFGDGWEHGIALEKVLPVDPAVKYPVCTAGKLLGPPEDCGGIYGYYELLEAIRDPEHDRHEELLEWVGEGYDPDAFSVDEVNERLAPFQRRRVKS